MPDFELLMARRPELRRICAAVDDAYLLLSGAFRSGGKVLVCGNGGSAADAEHIVGELMKSMARPRPLTAELAAALLTSAPDGMALDAAYLADNLELALPAISLTSQSGLLTAIGNDTAGDVAFAQQVHGYGRPGDVLWAISTSGRSRNVVLAGLAARAAGMKVLAMTGERGEVLGALGDVWLRAPAASVSEVQELHQAIYHAICAALEDDLLARNAFS